MRDKEWNAFQKRFVRDFMVQCLYKPEISDRLLKLGLAKKTYPKCNLQEDSFGLVSALKKSTGHFDGFSAKAFEKECKDMGFEEHNDGCRLF